MDTTRASLLIRVRDRNNASAWREFDAIYRPMLGRFARARGLDDSSADDIVQFAMMAIAEHIGGFDYNPDKGRFKAWLRTIVNNRIRNRVAARHEEEAQTRDFKRDDRREETPDEMFDRMWMKEHLDFAMNEVRLGVEPSSWEAFEALVIRDEPIEAVSERLKMNANQLYSIKFRLTKKLSERMQQLLGSEDEPK